MARFFDDIDKIALHPIFTKAADAERDKGEREKMLAGMSRTMVWEFEPLKSAVVVDAQNVAKYFFEIDDREHYDIITDFQHVTPPFVSTWLEAKIPAHVYSRERGHQKCWMREQGFTRWAMLITRETLQRDAFTGTLATIEKPARPLSETKGRGSLLTSHTWRLKDGELKILDAKWMLRFVLILEHKSAAIGPVATWAGYLDKNGCFMRADESSEHGLHGSFFIVHYGLTGKFHDEWLSIELESRGFLNCAMMALQFMNCRNVALDEVRPHTKLVEKRQRRYGKGLVTYRQIKIAAMGSHVPRAHVRSGASAAEGRAVPSLHIRRGHWKHFTKEKPLFGKYEGTFWWEQHVAGDLKSGLVGRDAYVVEGSNA